MAARSPRKEEGMTPEIITPRSKMHIRQAAELPAVRAQTMARELWEVRNAVYDGNWDVVLEMLTGFRAHLGFLEHELARLEGMVHARREFSDE